MYSLYFCIVYTWYALFYFLFYHVEGTSILKASTVIFRHGERNPIRSYPNDPYSNETLYWPEGYGIMTKEGNDQVYKLGHYLGERYFDVPLSNLFVFSSQRNRTLTSANIMLNGYLANRKDIPLMNLTDHRNRITVIPLDKDDFIFVSQPCPQYYLLRDMYRNSSKVDLFGGWKKEVDIISKNTGMTFNSVDLNIFFFVDTILTQKLRNLTLPPWAEQLYKSGAIDGMKNFFYTSSIPTPELTRLFTGSILARFIESMDQVVKDDLGVVDTTLTIISGHDTTLAFWLTNLEISSNMDITNGAALMLDLHQSVEINGEKEFHIEIFYKNDTKLEPTRLKIPGCATPCLYSKFRNLMEPKSLWDREEQCRLSENGDNARKELRNSANDGQLVTVKNCYSIFVALLSIFL